MPNKYPNPHSLAPSPFFLHLIPNPVELFERSLADANAAFAGDLLHTLEATRELDIRSVERERGMHTSFATHSHNREQQIAKFILESFVMQVVPRRR